MIDFYLSDLLLLLMFVMGSLPHSGLCSRLCLYMVITMVEMYPPWWWQPGGRRWLCGDVMILACLAVTIDWVTFTIILSGLHYHYLGPLLPLPFPIPQQVFFVTFRPTVPLLNLILLHVCTVRALDNKILVLSSRIKVSLLAFRYGTK